MNHNSPGLRKPKRQGVTPRSPWRAKIMGVSQLPATFHGENHGKMGKSSVLNHVFFFRWCFPDHVLEKTYKTRRHHMKSPNCLWTVFVGVEKPPTEENGVIGGKKVQVPMIPLTRCWSGHTFSWSNMATENTPFIDDFPMKVPTILLYVHLPCVNLPEGRLSFPPSGGFRWLLLLCPLVCQDQEELSPDEKAAAREPSTVSRVRLGPGDAMISQLKPEKRLPEAVFVGVWYWTKCWEFTNCAQHVPMAVCGNGYTTRMEILYKKLDDKPTDSRNHQSPAGLWHCFAKIMIILIIYFNFSQTCPLAAHLQTEVRRSRKAARKKGLERKVPVFLCSLF